MKKAGIYKRKEKRGCEMLLFSYILYYQQRFVFLPWH